MTPTLINERIQKLHGERWAAIREGRAILGKAEDENRDLNAEEQMIYDRIMADVKSIDIRSGRLEEMREEDADEPGEGSQTRDRDYDPASEPGAQARAEATDELEPEVRAWLHWMATGERSVNYEGRALQVDSAEAGGYIVAPEQFVNRLIKAADDQVFMRRFGTVLPSLRSAQGAGIPSLDADPADADWTSEISTGSEDSTMDFGKRLLTPHPLAKLIKVSNTLMRLSNIGVEGLVRERFNYKFGITEEKGFLTGTGSNQPLGIFTAHADGISTGRDEQTGSATNFTGDGLRAAKYGLKAQYRNRSQWLFHRDGIELISKLVDGNSQYLWQPGLRANDPDTLLGRPINESEYAPSTFTTGLYVGMLADFSFYWIVDSLQMTMQRLVELYAATNQTGFIGRKETDGMPVLEEAFVRLITN